jgi:hypothetical protein
LLEFRLLEISYVNHDEFQFDLIDSTLLSARVEQEIMEEWIIYSKVYDDVLIELDRYSI